jgi:hypothetical protein
MLMETRMPMHWATQTPRRWETDWPTAMRMRWPRLKLMVMPMRWPTVTAKPMATPMRTLMGRPTATGMQTRSHWPKRRPRRWAKLRDWHSGLEMRMVMQKPKRKLKHSGKLMVMRWVRWKGCPGSAPPHPQLLQVAGEMLRPTRSD